MSQDHDDRGESSNTPPHDDLKPAWIELLTRAARENLIAQEATTRRSCEALARRGWLRQVSVGSSARDKRACYVATTEGLARLAAACGHPIADLPPTLQRLWYQRRLDEAAPLDPLGVLAAYIRNSRSYLAVPHLDRLGALLTALRARRYADAREIYMEFRDRSWMALPWDVKLIIEEKPDETAPDADHPELALRARRARHMRQLARIEESLRRTRDEVEAFDAQIAIAEHRRAAIADAAASAMPVPAPVLMDPPTGTQELVVLDLWTDRPDADGETRYGAAVTPAGQVSLYAVVGWADERAKRAYVRHVVSGPWDGTLVRVELGTGRSVADPKAWRALIRLEEFLTRSEMPPQTGATS